jgi:hypothetical protein
MLNIYNIKEIEKEQERYEEYIDLFNELREQDFVKFKEKKELVQNIIVKIKNDINFDINQVIINHQAHFMYSTILENILATNNLNLINFVLERFSEKIEKEFCIESVNTKYNIISVFYNNFVYDNNTDAIIPLVFYFEDLSFLNVVYLNTAKKESLLKDLKVHSENYYLNKCSDSFKQEIKEKIKELFHLKVILFKKEVEVFKENMLNKIKELEKGSVEIGVKIDLEHINF